MSRWERFGVRDLTYSAWHRTLPDDVTMIDIDAEEYCRYCRHALALVETAQDVGQSFKATIVLRNLAAVANVPAFLVFYRADGNGMRFRVRQVAPTFADIGVLSGEEWGAHLLSIHRDHHAICRLGESSA